MGHRASQNLRDACAGGFLVSERKLDWERVKSQGKHAIFLFALAATLAFAASCGSTTSTTSTPTITVSCTPTDVIVLNTAQCTATVLNLSSTLVNWSVAVTNGGTGSAGTITPAGLYTAPATVPSNSVTITATSQVQSTLTATQPVTIEQAQEIHTVSCVDPNTNTTPSPLAVSSGNQLDCTATDANGAIVAVNWSVANATSGLAGNVGTVSSRGIYTAPLVPPPGQKVTITATSQAVPTMTPGTATVTVVFGSTVISGNYVFSASGRLPTGAFWARTGTFSAGGGIINSGGLEDTNQGGSPNIVTLLRSFSGSYSVGPDGRGTMQFCESAANSQAPVSCPFGSGAVTASFRIAVVSPQQVLIMESSTLTTSGEMVLQDSSIFQSGSQNSQSLDGVYSFGFTGVSSSGSQESAAGDFQSDGFGHIDSGTTPFPGKMDTIPGATALLGSTTYTVSANRRGTMTLNGLTFSFYPISSSRAKFIEIDQPDSILLGDAYLQQNSPTCGWTTNVALKGPTVLETLGQASGFVVADVGAFTATNGSVTGVSMDQNSAGSYSQPAGTGSDAYAVDADHCGRGTLSVAGHSYVFYIVSSPSSATVVPVLAVLLETTSGTVASGLLLPSQSGSFTDGSYAFRMQGTDAAGAAGQEEDLLGQFTSATAAVGGAVSWNGTLDLNDFGSAQIGLPITGGVYTPSTGVRSAGTFPIGNPATTTRNLILYMVSPTLFYVLDKDATGTALGTINNQF